MVTEPLEPLQIPIKAMKYISKMTWRMVEPGGIEPPTSCMPWDKSICQAICGDLSSVDQIASESRLGLSFAVASNGFENIKLTAIL